MGVVKTSSANIATLYLTSLAFIVLCVYNFSSPVTFLVNNTNYGAALLVLSVFLVITGITAGDSNDPLLRAFLLILGSLWTALAMFHLARGQRLLAEIDPPESLFPGYGAFIIIFSLFAVACVLHNARFTAVLSLGLFLSCIFEIASLWQNLKRSSGAYYLLLASMTLFESGRRLFDKMRGNEKVVKKVTGNDKDLSRDYVVVGHAMNTLAFAVFASHVTGITTVPRHSFMWVMSAGIFQGLSAAVSMRRSDAYNGCYFSLFGTFWIAIGVNLIMEYVTETDSFPLIAVFIFFIVLFVVASIVSLTKDMYQSFQNLLFAVFCIALCVDGLKGKFLGGMGWVCFLFSLYGFSAHLTRVQHSSFKLPLGCHCFEAEKLKSAIQKRARCFAACLYGRLSDSASKSEFSSDTMLGYAKYIDLDMIGFASNAVAALAMVWTPGGQEYLILPWVIGIGGLAQFIVGSVCFARGLTFESCTYIVFSTLWIIWGTARGLNVLILDNTAAMVTGCISYLVIGLLLLGLSMVINKAWFVVTLLFELVVLAFLLDALSVPGHIVFEIVIVIIFALVCLYCFAATALKAVWGRTILPLGAPIIQCSYLHSQGGRAFWASAKKASGVKAIADIMNKGGICGIPTDVVYVLVAACKFPKSVERAYNTKKLAEDRPMSMWISNVNQLAAGRELFGELLWDFMQEVWPSTISLVVPKGPWLDSLGIGASEKFIGRPDSIAVRMPDNCVTSFLIDQTGPVATSSANPTGEADTTHHLQVLAKLGIKNCDGILCDGPSHENMASTVVDCRRINDGVLGFFRIGVVPKSHVEKLFQNVQARHGLTSVSRQLSSIDSGVSEKDFELQIDAISNGRVNLAFVPDDTSSGDLTQVNSMSTQNLVTDSSFDSCSSGHTESPSIDFRSPPPYARSIDICELGVAEEAYHVKDRNTTEKRDMVLNERQAGNGQRYAEVINSDTGEVGMEPIDSDDTDSDVTNQDQASANNLSDSKQTPRSL